MKNISLFTTLQLSAIIQLARRLKPYKVAEIASDDFFDFKHLAVQIRNLDVDTEGSKLR